MVMKFHADSMTVSHLQLLEKKCIRFSLLHDYSKLTLCLSDVAHHFTNETYRQCRPKRNPNVMKYRRILHWITDVSKKGGYCIIQRKIAFFQLNYRMFHFIWKEKWNTNICGMSLIASRISSLRSWIDAGLFT